MVSTCNICKYNVCDYNAVVPVRAHALDDEM